MTHTMIPSRRWTHWLLSAAVWMLLLLTVLMVIMWIRSWWSRDELTIYSQRSTLTIESHKGLIGVQYHTSRPWNYEPWTVNVIAGYVDAVPFWQGTASWATWKHRYGRFHLYRGPGFYVVVIAHSVVMAVSCSLGVLVWLWYRHIRAASSGRGFQVATGERLKPS